MYCELVGVSGAGRERRGGSGREHARNLQHLLVDLLQGIDALLELDVVGRELGLQETENVSGRAA